MITVHHLENSRSQRILWLLEELGLDYEVKRYQRQKSMAAPPELFEIHPLGKSPVITDADQTVAESGAIVEYLIETYGDGRLQPVVGTAEHRQCRYWMHYAEGSFMPLLVMTLIFLRIPESPMPFFAKPIAKGLCKSVRTQFLTPQISNNLKFLESSLVDEWFAGSAMSAADIQMSFPVEAAAKRVGIESYPKLQAWLDRVHARPAYQRALETGGTYDLFG